MDRYEEGRLRRQERLQAMLSERKGSVQKIIPAPKPPAVAKEPKPKKVKPTPPKPPKIISHIISVSNPKQKVHEVRSQTERARHEKKAAQVVQEAKERQGQTLKDIIEEAKSKGLSMVKINNGVVFIKPGKQKHL